MTLSPVYHWYCPNCLMEDTTVGPRQNRYHTCTKLRGLISPLLPRGVRAKVEAVEREDYVGKEQVQLDPERGRPVMSVVTTRDEGQDVIAFAPMAVLTREEFDG